MFKRSLVSLGVCLVLVGFVGAVLAQDSKTVYTQVGLWDVSREKWGAYVEYFEKHEKPVMERLMADGTLMEWGFESNRLHDPEGYSHASWMSAHSLANLEKALDAYYESVGPDASRLEAELAGMVIKHRDLIVTSDHYGFRPAKIEGGYSVGSFVQVKPGKATEFRQAFESWAKPVFEQLLADGTIVSYTMGTEYFHTSAPGGMWTWYVTETPEAVDKAEAAFQESWSKLSPADRDARWDHRGEVVEPGSHRDGYTRLIHYQCK